jgi:hypothetical protein
VNKDYYISPELLPSLILNGRMAKFYCHSKYCAGKVFFLWLCSPIFGLLRLHKNFRFISVTRSRTAGWTPWTGDQAVARPVLTAPGDCDYDGEVGE